MSIAEKIKFFEQEYLQGEQVAEFKYVYLNSEVWVMVGASDNHVTIAMNLTCLLR